MSIKSGLFASRDVLALIGLAILFLGCGKSPSSQTLVVSNEPPRKELELVRPEDQIKIGMTFDEVGTILPQQWVTERARGLPGSSNDSDTSTRSAWYHESRLRIMYAIIKNPGMPEVWVVESIERLPE